MDEIDLSTEVEDSQTQAADLDLDTPIVRFVNKILQDAIRRKDVTAATEYYTSIVQADPAVDSEYATLRDSDENPDWTDVQRWMKFYADQ